VSSRQSNTGYVTNVCFRYLCAFLQNVTIDILLEYKDLGEYITKTSKKGQEMEREYHLNYYAETIYQSMDQ
jgi:hypothetical protein